MTAKTQSRAKMIGLRFFRQKANLTQAELAEKIGVCKQAISAWERGKVAPCYAVARVVAMELGCTPERLFEQPPDDMCEKRHIVHSGLEAPGIRRERKKAGITQAELGKRLGVTKQYISLIETKRNRIQLSTAIHLAEALGCSVEDLY